MEKAKLPWTVEQTELRLSLCHDHRWLRVIGFPAIALGASVAIGIWFIPGINFGDAWPMLMVGALMGVACILMGLQLSFSVVVFSVERGRQELVRQEGFSPFLRTQRFAIDQTAVVKISRQADPGMMSGYILELKTSTSRIRIAKFPDLQPIASEGKRWATFLGLPLEE